MTEQEILDGAPKDNKATHTETLESTKIYYLKKDKQGMGYDVLLSNEWTTSMAVTGYIRSLSDIQTIVDLRKQVAELEKELETERMRLAACGVIALSNTRESAAKQRDMHEDYKSASLSEVIRAVDTEIEQRERIAELEKENEKLKERNRKLDVDLLRALFYAPSSPVSPCKAHEIEVWYGKFKQVHLATKEAIK